MTDDASTRDQLLEDILELCESRTYCFAELADMTGALAAALAIVMRQAATDTQYTLLAGIVERIFAAERERIAA